MSRVKFFYAQNKIGTDAEGATAATGAGAGVLLVPVSGSVPLLMCTYLLVSIRITLQAVGG